VPAPVVVAEVVRSGFVEGRHHGSVVALAPDGSVDWSLGDVDSPIFPRSCNKPLQVVGMLRAGLDLDGALLALGCASHSGEAFHLEGVRAILAGVGLDESALRTPPDLPLDEDERRAALRDGRSPAPVAMNCSGKHAAMLATCAVNEWDVSTYLSPDHPLQVALLDAFGELTRTPPAEVSVGVDGCGAPLFSTSLTSLASAFRTLALARSGPEHRVAQAIRDFPAYVSGTRRDEAALLRAVPGAIAKAGAEASYAVALPDGRAVALKVDDGGTRARPAVMAAALLRSGVEDLPGADADAVRETGRVEVLGGGRVVGSVRATVA
jgi:L-asparaginase II